MRFATPPLQDRPGSPRNCDPQSLLLPHALPALQTGEQLGGLHVHAVALQVHTSESQSE
jgi:hypothetical protein